MGAEIFQNVHESADDPNADADCCRRNYRHGIRFAASLLPVFACFGHEFT
ncbi:MAG: hypothetical protein ACI9HK_000635 [Pirellulaceae bacterium]|jgi:hypothetical protein